VSQLYKITYVRKQVTTDYLHGAPIREVTTEITETIGGLPASTVANYRKVLGNQIISVEQEFGGGSGYEREALKTGKVKRDGKRTTKAALSGPAAAVAEDDDAAFTGSYAGIINRMVEKEQAA
jgi:hypothetical protein